jgi:flavodoxin
VKALIVYDTKFGHNEKIAQAIGDAFGGKVLPVEEGNPSDLQDFSLVILGSPTHGGFPTEGINNLSNDAAALAGVESAAFDTRTKATIFGYAAPKIGHNLERSGAHLVAQPEGFFVLGKKGPLKGGELERTAAWAKELIGA